MADLAIGLAKKPRPQVKDLKWDKMFVKGRKWTVPSTEYRVQRADVRSSPGCIDFDCTR